MEQMLFKRKTLFISLFFYLSIFVNQIAFSQAPTVSFTMSPSNPKAGEIVTFTSTSTNVAFPVYYTWDFGDGAEIQISSIPNPTAKYTTGGEKTVTLKLCNGSPTTNCASATKTLPVYSVGDGTNALQLDFTASNKKPKVNQSISLTSDVTGGKGILRFQWDAGKNGTLSSATDENPTVNYSSAGNKEIKLTVTDDKGAKTETKSNFITVQPDDLPLSAVTADFHGCGTYNLSGATITFSNNSVGGEGAPYTCDWDFGDGSTATGEYIYHRYTQRGKYDVTMTVSDGINTIPVTKIGCINITEFGTSGLQPGFSINDIPIEKNAVVVVGVNQPVIISDNSEYPENNNVEYIWQFAALPWQKPDVVPSASSKKGPHVVYFKYPNETMDISLRLIDHSVTLENNKVAYRAGAIITKPLRAGGSKASLDDVSLSTNCWVKGGPYPKVNVKITHNEFEPSIRISSSTLHKVLQDGINKKDGIIDFGGNPPAFPLIDTWRVEVGQYDGEVFTPLDSKEIDVVLYGSNPSAGSDANLCIGLTKALGSAPEPGVTYQWSSNGNAYLSSLNTSTTTFTAQANGTFYCTLIARDAHGCVSTSSAKMVVSDVTLKGKNYIVSKGEPVTFDLAAGTGGVGQGSYAYTWTPGTNLDKTNILNPTFKQQTGGVYPLILSATDTQCSGTTTVNVEVSKTAPSGLTANTYTEGEVTLKWQINTQDETSFVIERSTAYASGYVQIGYVGHGISQYIDQGLTLGDVFYYRVYALKNTTNLGYSNRVKAVLGPPGMDYRPIGQLFRPTPDGGFIAATLSVSASSPYTNTYTVQKTDACGTPTWTKIFTTKSDYDKDVLRNLLVTSDGNYLLTSMSRANVVAGTDKSENSRGGKDFWILKISQNGGGKLWDKTLGGIGFDNPIRLAESPSGYIVVGNSNSYASGDKSQNNSRGMNTSEWLPNLNDSYPVGLDVWIVKVNKTNGSKIWDKTIGNGQGDHKGYEALLQFRQDGESSYMLLRSQMGVSFGLLTFSYFAELDGNANPLRSQMLTTTHDVSILYSDFLVLNINGVKKLVLTRAKDYPPETPITGGEPAGYPRRIATLDYNNLGAVATLKTFPSIENDHSASPGFGFLTSKSGNNDVLFTLFYSGSGKTADKASSVNGYWLLGTDLVTGARVFERTMALGTIPGMDSYQKESDGSYTFFYNGQFIYNSGKKTYQPLLTTNAITPLVYYAGDAIQLGCTTKNCPSLANNTYTFQLSDGNGTFDVPVELVKVQSPAATVSVSATIPPTTSPNNTYLVRTLSSSPSITGTDNGQYITIKLQEIITGKISPLEYYPGNTIQVPFTTKGSFPTINVFKVQLSDASGSFTSPTTLVTTASSANSITATIPSTTTFGSGYRVRVIASSPAVTGTANTDDIRIGALITNQPAQPVYYGGDLITVSFVAKAAFNTGNRFFLELSDASGKFTSVSQPLGFIEGTTSSSITATIPVETIASMKYKVRVSSTSPALTGIENPLSFTIWDLALTTNKLASNQLLCGDNIKVPYTVLGNFNAPNKFTVQLSDANGFFTYPVTISIPFEDVTSGILDATIPSNTKPGNGYRVRVVGSSPSKVGSDNGEDISIGVLQITDINPKVYFQGGKITIPFITKYPFDGRNVYEAQLSDAQGNFDNDNPVLIGYQISMIKNGAGKIFATIPQNTPIGEGYKIRLHTTSPEFYSPATLFTITVVAPEISFTIPESITSCGVDAGFDIPFTVTGNFSDDNVFTAQLSDLAGVFDDKTLKNIGYTTGKSSGTIHAVIPSGIRMNASSKYSIRIVSSSPVASATSATKISFLTYPTVSNITVCKGANVLAVPKGTISNGTYNWYSWNLGSGTQFISSGPTLSLPNVQEGTYTYLVSYAGVNDNNIACETNPSSFNVTVRPIPVAPVVTKGLECPSGEIVKSLKLDNALPAGYNVYWYDSPTGSNLLYAGTEYRPVINQSTTYYVAYKDELGTCESTTRTPAKMVYFPSNFLVVSSASPKANEQVDFTTIPEVFDPNAQYYLSTPTYNNWVKLPVSIPATSQVAVYTVRGGACNLSNSITITTLFTGTGTTNTGLQFNKTAEYCAVPDKGKLNLGTSDVTFEATIKASTIQNGYPAILSTRSTAAGGFDGFLFGLSDNGRVFVQFDGSNFYQPGGIDLRDNKCHTIAVARIGTTVKFYVDGLLSGSIVHPAVASNITPDIASDLWIGNDKPNRNSNTPFNGVIDNVRIWTKALDDATIFNNTNRKVYGVQPNLLGYWTFDEESGNKIAFDNTTNNLNASLYAGTANPPVRVAAADCYADNWAMKFGGNIFNVMVRSISKNAMFRTGEFTLEAYIRANPITTGISPIICLSGPNNVQSVFLGIDWSTKELIAIMGNQKLNPIKLKTNYIDDQCHHVALVRTNDATYTTVTFYLDGIAIASEKAITNSNYLSYDVFATDFNGTGSTMLSIGNVQITPSYTTFPGFMDNVRIWNVARTSSQLQANMSSTLTSATGLGVNWIFDLYTRPYAYDQSGNKNQGTILGSAVEQDFIFANELCLSPIKKTQDQEVDLTNESLSLNVSPNPFLDHIHVVIPGNDPASGELIIVDMKGVTVFRTTIASGENALDINPSLSSGIYQVVVSKGDIYLTSKITKLE